MPSAIEEMLQELYNSRAGGQRLTPEEVVAAVVHLEPKQAEAMCQVLWALPLAYVLFYVQRGNASAIAWPLTPLQPWKGSPLVYVLGHTDKLILTCRKIETPNLARRISLSKPAWKKMGLTVKDVKESLRENIDRLIRLCNVFDDGDETFALLIAVGVRTLVHDTTKSHSVIKTLHMLSTDNTYSKNRIGFYDTSGAEVPGNLMSHDFFLVRALGDKGVRYYAPLDDSPFSNGRKASFDDWWDKQPIFIDAPNRNQFSRKRLVLTIANQAGGAHLDPYGLDEDIYGLMKANSMGGKFIVSDGGGVLVEKAPDNQPAYPAIRQIAHELLKTLSDVVPELFSKPYAVSTLEERRLPDAGIFLYGATMVQGTEVPPLRH